MISPVSQRISTRQDLAFCLTAVLVVFLFTVPSLMTGWFPHDDGQLGQAAERFLVGELPHRDFDDMYTGLLTVLHAAAFAAFGIHIESTRWMLLAAFVPFLLSIYRVARRWATPRGAFLTTALAGMWSVPLNPESMPSWYILFLAAGLLDVLLLFTETGRHGWLFAAGLLAGLSVLFKITGIYLVAAGVLFLIWHEQRLSRPGASRSTAFSLWNTFCLLIYTAAAINISSPQDRLMSALHLTIPAALPGLLAIRGEWQFGHGTATERLRQWLRFQLTFAAGVLLPLACWGGWYWYEGALGALYEGLVVLPRRRLESAGAAFPEISALLVAGTVFCSLFLVPLLPRNSTDIAATATRRRLMASVAFCADPADCRLSVDANCCAAVSFRPKSHSVCCRRTAVASGCGSQAAGRYHR